MTAPADRVPGESGPPGGAGHGTSDADGLPVHAEFRRDVADGLSAASKVLPPKYLYDETGCDLFEAITKLDEYYLTRAETSILERYAAALGNAFREVTTLIELGGISAGRSELMLRSLPRLTRYVPVDIADEPLVQATRLANLERPEVTVAPTRCDFTAGLDLPALVNGPNVLVFFPGSSIGNLEPDDAVTFLHDLGTALPGAHLLVGVDRRKGREVLELAYNDSQGVTSTFNLNLLMRINFELDADFNLTQFRHEARYDEDLGRIEMHLTSCIDQTVRVGDDEFEFKAGESIHTESSYKYGVTEFGDLIEKAGWNWRGFWSDEDRLYAVHHCQMGGRCLDRS
ncbi:MAG: L-histidine N(alpha)-methyltransferase [Woeseiaceae bacterium]|nr:L-histidine N(alpha)-methyltransferase [Woeseiaceae bacterium]